MVHWINISLSLILAQALVLVEAIIYTEICIPNTDRNRSAQLNCSEGFISNVTVTSGTGSCYNKGTGKCSGKTPTLMVDYMNCYWRHDCKINWPSDLIIFTESISKDCIGREPTFMAISYKCFYPTDFQEDYGYSKTTKSDIQPKILLIDACSKLGNTQKSYFEQTGPANTGGIIRSHRLYPWNYSNKPRNCSVKLYWPIEQHLIVSVKNVDLSDDDSLIIVNTDKTINASSDRTLNFSTGFETWFVFNVGTESNSGKGFLLCFKFVPNNDRRVQDACGDIMEDGDVKAVPDGVIPLSHHLQATSIPEPSTQKPVATTEPIPRCCLKKKEGKKRNRCIKKQKKKKKKCKDRKVRGNKNKKNKKRPKKNKRRRRHGVRKYNRRRGL